MPTSEQNLELLRRKQELLQRKREIIQQKQASVAEAPAVSPEEAAEISKKVSEISTPVERVDGKLVGVPEKDVELTPQQAAKAKETLPDTKTISELVASLRTDPKERAEFFIATRGDISEEEKEQIRSEEKERQPQVEEAQRVAGVAGKTAGLRPKDVAAFTAGGAAGAGARGLVKASSLIKKLADAGKLGKALAAVGVGVAEGTAAEIAFKGVKEQELPTSGELGTAAALGAGVEVLAPVAVAGVKKVAEKVKSLTPSARAAKKAAEGVEKIEETISPTLTAKAQRQAIAEQRATRGEKRRLFGDKPDIVEQSDEVKRAAETIDRRITNASKMNDLEIDKAAAAEIENISRKLSPQMSNVQVKEETIKKIDDVWDSVKLRQQDNLDFEAASGKKMQQQFEKALDKVSEASTMDDLWKTRIEYDKTVPKNVKEANALSTDVAIARKEMWLDNRRIINDAIEDSADGLGRQASSDFRDMNDLYNVRSFARTKKINVKGSEGLISPKKLTRLGLGYAGVKGIEEVFGVNIPFL